MRAFLDISVEEGEHVRLEVRNLTNVGVIYLNDDQCENLRRWLERVAAERAETKK